MQFRDLSARTKLRVTGADRVRFLNGQTTNDVRKASQERVQESCVLNAKGFFDAHLFLFAAPEAIYVDADEALRQSLPARLERYIISDDVILEDITERFALFHLLGDARPEVEFAEFAVRANRLALEGWDIWVSSDNASRGRTALLRSYVEINPTEWEQRRIEHGIPRWGAELTPEVMPPEANLQTRAIDYDKGCYIGQEIISRLKMSGQMRQRLCGLVGQRNSTLAAGMMLHAGEKAIGRITSAVYCERLHAQLALGFVKRGFYTPATQLSVADTGHPAVVTIVALPFSRD